MREHLAKCLMQLRTVTRGGHNTNGFRVSRFRDTLRHTHTYTCKADIVMAFAYRHMQSSKLRANSASEIEAFRILGAKYSQRVLNDVITSEKNQNVSVSNTFVREVPSFENIRCMCTSICISAPKNDCVLCIEQQLCDLFYKKLIYIYSIKFYKVDLIF